MKKLLLIILIFGLCSLMTPAQNVGVSDAAGLTPQCLLHIHKNSNSPSTLLQATNTVSGNGSGKGFTLDVDGSFNVTLNNRMNTSLGFNTNGTQKMIILNNGNVGIGTASPGQKLDVNGNIKLGDNMMVEGNTAWRVYRNLATYDNSNSAAAGAFVITTAQPWNSACMFRVKLEGYFYDNTAPFELTIGAYIYTNNSFYNYGYINIGAKIMNVRLARNITTNTVTIIIGDESGSYSYPKISVTSFTQGHSGINEAYADGWTITQETSLSNYDFIHTVPNVTTLPATSPDYIQNQNTADQAANFRITGTGRANTSFYAPLYTGAGNIAIRPGANSTTAIQLQNTGGTSILNVDATNNNVGIGTTTPSDKLHVNGNVKHNGSMVSQGANYASTWMQFDQDIYGNSLILGSGGLTTLGAGESANLVKANSTPGTETLYLSSDGGINLITNLQTDWASRIDAMTILTNGNVGIGTTSPSARLHTTGTVRFAGYPSGANGAIVRTDGSGNLAITNFTGNTTDILLGNNTFGTVAAAGGVTSACGTTNYLPKMSSSSAMACSQIYDNGTNVGIGTSTPPQKLSVEGGIHVKDGSYLDFVNWQWAMGRDINSTFSTGNELQVLGYGSSGNSFQIIGITGSSPSYTYSRIFQANLDNGNVGIGTSPTARLDINGDLKINSQSSTQKRHISTITRSIGGSAGDYVYLGTITSNGAGTYASIRQSHHFCGTINAAAYEITDVYYSGTTTDWMQVPTQNYRSYSGNQDFSIDVRRSASHPTTLEVRARNLGGPCGGGSIDFEIQTNGTFTASTTSGSGASVAGFLSNNAYQFPVSNNLFKASTDGIFILNSGNVGIGTTSPTAQLHTTGTVRLQNYTSGTLQVDANGYLSVGSGSNVFNAGTGLSWSGNTLNSLWTANGNNIYNNNSGNVGIGTTSPAAKLEVAGGVRVGNGFNISIPNTCGGNWITSADMAIWTSDHTGGCGDEAYIAHYVRGTTGEATTLEIGNKNDADDHIALMPSGNVGIGTNNPDDKLDVVGNAQVSGYLKVGNPSAPSSVESNTPVALYSWNNQSGIYGLLSGSGCGSANWDFLIDGLSSYYRYDNNGSRAFKPLMTPWVWVPTTSSGVMIELNFYNSLEWEYDGVFVEYTTDGSTWTLVDSWQFGTYNHTNIDGSNSSCGADINTSGWSNTGYKGPWSKILALNGKWVRFRLVAIEDEAYNTGIFELYGLTIWAENAGSLGGSFADGNIYAQKNVYAGSNVLMGDVAEYFNVKGMSLPGYLISLNPNEKDAYVVSSKKNDANVIGIHSTAPTLTINSPNSGIPVALSGRVPVCVSNENGKISPGDYLTASSRPGYACKATEACYVIGQALENFDDREGKIICLLKQNWYMPYASSNTGSGNFFISKGKDKITIIDKKVNEDSKVFLTMLGDPQQRFWISEKANGSFTLSFSGEVFQDVNFDYFIDNANKEPAEESNKIQSNDEYVSVNKPLDFDRGGWQFDKKKNIYWRPEPEKNYTSKKEVEMISDEEPAPPKPDDENSGYIFYKNELIKTLDRKIGK